MANAATSKLIKECDSYLAGDMSWQTEAQFKRWLVTIIKKLALSSLARHSENLIINHKLKRIETPKKGELV